MSRVIHAREQNADVGARTHTRARLRKKTRRFRSAIPIEKTIGPIPKATLHLYESSERSGSNARGSMRIRLSFFARSVGRWVARLQGTRLSQLELELAGKERQEQGEGRGKVQSKRTRGGEQKAKENRAVPSGKRDRERAESR